MPKTQTKRVVKTKRVTKTRRSMPTKRTHKSPAKQEYEKRLIRKRLGKEGIDPQTVDVNALYDANLSYQENLTNLGLSKKTRFTSQEQFNFKRTRVQSIHNDRSKRAKILDEVRADRYIIM